MICVVLSIAHSAFFNHRVDAPFLQGPLQSVKNHGWLDRVYTRTLRQALYFLKRGSHSSVEELPRRYSELAVTKYSNLFPVADSLSEYHFKKQVSYFLDRSALSNPTDSVFRTYSLTSLHSGAKEADIVAPSREVSFLFATPGQMID